MSKNREKAFADHFNRGKEPIAIIGIGCRFPGNCDTPKAYWKLLLGKTDAVTEIPRERWDVDAYYDPDFSSSGKISVRRGGFVQGVDLFDAGFFGISPMEAQRMDPQHRMLLEVTYEAIEDAGLALERLAGSRTGVFVGISAHDYGDIQNTPSERVNIGAHTNTGTAQSIASNRISYSFDLRGPSFSVDTACSSSLVAIHLACRSLWTGESELAIAGGVNSIIKPEPEIGFSKGGFLAPDGRCKSFDSRANGYIRSEGTGVILLKPLSRALADGDPIYALIRASVINEDGATNGIAVPSPEAQEAMLLEAYHGSGIDPHLVQFVEAHGTGTPVGDPIEAKAIGRVLGAGRNDYCYLGSVKSNLGHLEPASGIAGITKLALAMKHRLIPPNIHFEKPNPDIPFEELRLKVPTEAVPWPEAPRGMFAGVNSFGFGGANAHVILQGAPDERATRSALSRPEGAELIALSARSRGALKALARDYLTWLDGEGRSVSLRDIAYSSVLRRSHHTNRLALAVKDHDSLKALLAAYLAGEARDGLAERKALTQHADIAFVFSGQGPQWFAMGSQLMRLSPVYRGWVEEIDRLFSRHADWSLLAELSRDEATSRISETQIAQPAIFALQVAAAELWKSWGVVPRAVVGHSIGEVAAAFEAGALDLEQAVRVIFHRSRVQAKATGKGKMLAVGLELAEARARVAEYAGRIDVAAVNGPKAITLAGDSDALEALARSLDEDDVFHRFLRVNVPFHCHHMEPLKPELVSSLEGLQPQPTNIPLYSTVSGALVQGPELDAHYWCRNVRDTVHFTDAIAAMADAGFDTFVEIAPHPVLSDGIQETLESVKKKGFVVHTLRRKEDEVLTLTANLARLHSWGAEIDFSRLFLDGGAFVQLPRYPWQRERYWLESEQGRRQRLGLGAHPHLMRQSVSAREKSNILWEVSLDKRVHKYIDEHRVQGPVIFPGAGHVELALSAGLASFAEAFDFLENVNFESALFLPDEGEPPGIQLDISHDGGNYFIYTKPQGAESWTLCSNGRMSHIGERFESQAIDLAAVRGRVTRKVAVDEMHDALDRGGLQLGPAFRCVKKLWYGENETYGELEVHESIRSGIDRFNLHPAVLDGCFQTMFGLFFERHERGERMGVYIPIHIDRVKLHRKPGSNKLYVYGKLRSWSDEHTLGDLWIFNEQDELVAEFQGFRTQYLKGSRGEQGNEAELWFYEFNWRMKTRADLAQARDSGQFLPGPAVLAETAREPIREIQGSARQREYYDEIEPDLYRACVGYILNAFSAMGLPVRAGSRIDPTAALKSASIHPKHARLFRHLFELLKGSGVASELGGVFELGETRSPAEPSALLAELSKKHPRFQHDLSLLSRCGPELKQVLQGKTDPIQLLFPEDQWDSIVQFYVEAFAFKKYYDLAKPVIAELVRRLPPEQNLRVLELGAGTGGMTQALLPLLPPERTEYVFTDLSQLFLLKAKQRFSRFPFVQYRTLDIEKPPSRAELGSFDLVIASDVLHATRDLKKTLTNVKELLASEGMLLMLEVTNTPIFLDLIFGMTEGWWLFEDKERRKTHATMPPQQWRTLLEESEFSDVQLLSDFAANERACQTLILARGPELARDGQLHLAAKANEGRCLVFADNRGVHERLEARLRGFGKTCIRVLPGERYRQLAPDRFELNPLDPEDMSKLVERTLGAETIESTLFLWALNNPDNTSLSVETLEKGEQSGSLPLLHYMRCMNRSGRKTFPATWIVTAGAQNVAGIPETVQLGQSAIRGVGRVIINEFSHIETTIVDLSESAEDDEIAALAEEMIAGDREEELAFRGRRRFVNRLERIGAYAAARSAQKSVGAAGYPFTTAITEAGLLDNLVLREAQRRQPGAREVEIQVKAAALNFRDVMIAMGLLSEDAIRGGHFGRNFGLECSGVVSRVGNDVRDFAPGDEVFGFAPASISGFAVAKDCLTLKKPRRLSWEEAASLPAVYLTAYYSLFHHCRLAAGEKILIHAAAGGVGTAAIHLARAVGAEIYATVGSEEKRRYVQSLGVKAEHTFDSRSLAFADEIMAATGGAGVDVVLNSLAGPAIHKSVRCLAPYGRFVEIGKTDIYRNSKLALEPFGNNLSYFAVDIDRMLEQKPEFASRMLREAMRFFEENAIPPHAVTTFPAARVADAFVTMAGARHTGKVAVSVADEILVSPPAEIAFKDAATYLVTGGASGFGLAVANWMTTKGARHLALLSRSGPKTDEESIQIQAMRARGVEVQLLEGDVTRRDDVERVLEQIRRSMPPLAGIHHAAMVLDDGMIPELDAQRYFKAYRPKVLGAWNLHVATRDLPLDFFVQYSSVSAVFGVPGQANYAAANNFLDGLSQFRRSQGLASMTINWGALGDVGFVARAGHVEASLTKQGWNVFSLEQSTSVLETMMLQNPVQRAATDTNWEKVGEFFPARLNTSRFGHLMREKELGGQAGGSGDGALRAMLLSAEPSQRSGILSTSLRDALARVVGMGAEKIDPADPVTKLGLDSLMANQIRNWIHGNTGVDYSMMRIMRGPTLHELTSQVLDELIGTSASAQTASDSSADRWLLRPRLVEKPRLRIFCFPYFGGGASVYAPWATELPSDVEVCAVQFPGREERETERAHDRIEELVDELAQLLAPLLDRPYVFYAHSAGAAVSYELVRRLRRDRKPLPLHLVVGGSRAPHLPSAFSVIEGLPEAEVLKRENSERIVAYMRRLEIPEGVLQNRELMHRMLPSLRADILLGMRYSYRPEAPLPCPVTAVAGERDSVLGTEPIKAWAKHTSGRFTFKLVSGSHLFVRDNRHEVLKIIREIVGAR